MFFWKKKEKPKPKPTPYEADIEIKKDRIEYGLRYWAQADPLRDFLNIAEEVVREFLEGYILYIVKYELKPEKMEGVLKYIQSFSDAEYAYDFDRNCIIEKQKRFKSYLFDYYYKKENGEEVEHDFRNFYIYAYKNDIEIEMECEARKREDFMLDNTADIIVSYEELCEGPTIVIRVKKEVYDFEKYMKLCINTLKKYGKNTKFTYIDETIDEN